MLSFLLRCHNYCFLNISRHLIGHSYGPDLLYLLQGLQIQAFVTITLTLIFIPKVSFFQISSCVVAYFDGALLNIFRALCFFVTIVGLCGIYMFVYVKNDDVKSDDCCLRYAI